MSGEVGRVLTVGHGSLVEEDLRRLLRGAVARLVIDVRRFPGSRRHPQVARAALERWLPEAGIAYRWSAPLGGRRSPRPDSSNTGLRNTAFRGYADHLALVRGCAVDHLGHDGRRTSHPPADTARHRGDDVRYVADPTPELPWPSGAAFT